MERHSCSSVTLRLSAILSNTILPNATAYLDEFPDAGDDDEDGPEHHADGEDQLKRPPVHGTLLTSQCYKTFFGRNLRFP
jgi:hypothetical protein